MGYRKTWKDEKKFQAQLEEYRQLKSEILSIYQTTNTIRSIIIAAYGAIATIISTVYVFRQEWPDPVLVLSTVFLPLVVLLMRFFSTNTMVKIGMYIEFALERELDGLNWETYVGLRARKEYRLIEFDPPLLPMVLILFSVGSSIGIWFTAKKSIAPALVFWGLIIFVGAILFLSIFLGISSIKKRARLAKRVAKAVHAAKHKR